MIRMILTDIEGTTTSISFVHETLFPYSSNAMPEFIKNHWDSEGVQAIAREVYQLESLLSELTPESLSNTLLEWIQQDRKATPLKTLQGMIWAAGYQSGQIKGHLYPDAHKWLTEWSKNNIQLAVFSSGSISAQKLLFEFSDFGDLSSIFSHNFDTTSGSKKDTSAYRSIQRAVDIPAEDILFLSDTAEELDAAKSCGMLTAQLVRAEDGTTPCEGHPIAKDFEEIQNRFFNGAKQHEHSSNI